MANKKTWITSGEACDILNVQPKALSAIVKKHGIVYSDKPGVRGYIYRRLDIQTAANWRSKKNNVSETAEQLKSKQAPRIKAFINEEVTLTLTGRRELIRAAAILLEGDDRFNHLSAEYPTTLDEVVCKQLAYTGHPGITVLCKRTKK